MKRTLPVLIGLVLTVALSTNALAARYASRILKEGSTGGDVRKLQRFLDTTGHDTAADGEFGPATAESLMDFERDEARKVDGVASRPDQRMVRARAAGEPEVAPSTGDRATIAPDGLAVAPASAPPEVAEIIAAGNEIATKPYKYGGGHGSWRDSGYDCSGSVSYALHGAGLLNTQLDSSALAAFGRRGRGEWVSVMGNAGHAYMVVAGLRFDTSSGKRSGNRWTARMRSSAGYAVRHPASL
jgi:peptidoglycan hydrolase-like protein with peptidoglycan-binding domain